MAGLDMLLNSLVKPSTFSAGRPMHVRLEELLLAPLEHLRQLRLGALQRRPGLVTQLHAKADLLQVYGHLYEHRDEAGLVHSLKVCDVYLQLALAEMMPSSLPSNTFGTLHAQRSMTCSNDF